MERSPASRQLRPDTAKNTNHDQRHAETDRRKIECRHTLPDHGSGANLELLNETRYGRILINTEIYRCLKRACLSAEAIRLIRIGQMHIKGREQKDDRSSRKGNRGEVELYHGKIESRLEIPQNTPTKQEHNSNSGRRKKTSTQGNPTRPKQVQASQSKGRCKNNTIRNNGKSTMSDCDEQKKRRSEREKRGGEGEKGARTPSGAGVPGKEKAERTPE